ncbi:glycine cleavage system aminomethyltransferase GcvT [Georgenia yuyongxinii]|uniref:Aminomethyltransferase n=1 Tax=Georgenia yuyongxinii TaxID=2589797 RepID=A0A552WT05_9MICO|nr:glycine cleavage system aminomethyltransferase GcvT [Georgenia yuyongxinii]TRW45806.1 glycine cleavage system aminomethyltransferase GcvT [Georgenia yuyongxinii]
MLETTARVTPLHGQHAGLGAAFTDFGGWQMPLKYTSELAEHHAVRRAAGLFDLSHMGEVWVSGTQAGDFLDYALVGRLSALSVGRAKYSLLCAEDGGIIDDLISYRRAEDRYLLVPNAGNTSAVVAALHHRAAGFDVEVADATVDTALIAIQGPAALDVLAALVPAAQVEAVATLRYYAAIEATTAGLDVLLARTGYTGEDGFELYLPHGQAPALWQALLAAGVDRGLLPAGLASRDSLRLEAGMPLYGNELSRGVDPYAAGLGGMVALSSPGDFVGRAALEAAKAAHEAATEPGAGHAGRRVLVGLKGTGKRAARAHQHVMAAGATVGEVTSGAPSPTLGYPIALAYVDPAHSSVGTTLEVDVRGTAHPFEVVRPPFYTRSG